MWVVCGMLCVGDFTGCTTLTDPRSSPCKVAVEVPQWLHAARVAAFWSKTQSLQGAQFFLASLILYTAAQQANKQVAAVTAAAAAVSAAVPLASAATEATAAEAPVRSGELAAATLASGSSPAASRLVYSPPAAPALFGAISEGGAVAGAESGGVGAAPSDAAGPSPHELQVMNFGCWQWCQLGVGHCDSLVQAVVPAECGGVS